MANETEKLLSEQDLSDGELVDQEPLEAVKEPPVRLAGYNLAPHINDAAKEADRSADE